MPLGTTHQETGLIVTEGWKLYLRTDQGGHWQLDAPLEVKRLIGRRVTIDGVRDGFDILAVHRVWTLGPSGKQHIWSKPLLQNKFGQLNSKEWSILFLGLIMLVCVMVSSGGKSLSNF